MTTTVVARKYRDNPPSVLIESTSIPTGATSVKVERLVDGAYTPVRGVAVVGGTLTATDWEAPTGREFIYRVTITTPQGVTETETKPVKLDDPADPSGIWISDPLQPSTALLVSGVVGTDDKRRFEVRSQPVYVAGAAYPRVSINSASFMPEVTVVAELDGDEADRLRGLLTGAAGVCVRFPASQHAPAVLYGVAEFTETPRRRWGGQWSSLFEVTVSVTGGVAGGVSASDWTYRDLLESVKQWRMQDTVYPSGARYRVLARRPN